MAVNGVSNFVHKINQSVGSRAARTKTELDECPHRVLSVEMTEHHPHHRAVGHAETFVFHYDAAIVSHANYKKQGREFVSL